MAELWEMSATAQAAAVKAGDVSSVELVQAHLDRIEAVNPAVNAVTRTMPEDSLAAAAAVDAARAAGDELGPLAGVPFTIKENIDVTGQSTTHGLQALADAVAQVDAPVVERMKAAGAVPLARTNLPDLGLRIHTDNELHGLTRNPWHPEHTAGGSSGGEGAALATGMSPIGLGNDLGGSLRNPASCCSIASIKPTTGRIPSAFTIPMADDGIVGQTFAVQGPMARTVADVRVGLHALAGPHLRDPAAAPVPLSAPESGTRRVALLAEPPGGVTDPGVAAVTRAAGDALTAAGCVVEEVEVPRFEEVVACWSGIVGGDIATSFPLLEPILGGDARELLGTLTGVVGEVSLADMGGMWMLRHSLSRAWAEFFSAWDVLVTPTWAQLPFKHGADVDATTMEDSVMQTHARPVLPANALGLPSAAVPAGIVDGLPVGVLVNGPAWSELLCLEVAEMIESAGIAPSVPIDPRS
ncbi:MAG: amidase [Actinomycetota bacterium]